MATVYSPVSKPSLQYPSGVSFQHMNYLRVCENTGINFNYDYFINKYKESEMILLCVCMSACVCVIDRDRQTDRSTFLKSGVFLIKKKKVKIRRQLVSRLDLAYVTHPMRYLLFY